MSHNSQPIIIPKNFNFIESIPVLNREMLISENAVINIYIWQNAFTVTTPSPDFTTA